MTRFLADEDLPRSLVPQLRAAGIAADDVRDAGLRGKSDDEIFEYAVSHGLTLLTVMSDSETFCVSHRKHTQASWSRGSPANSRPPA